MNTITISKDNSFSATNKRDVTIDKETMTYELKKFFNWKTPTKRYNTFIERYFSLGSSDYDRFANYLIEQGY